MDRPAEDALGPGVGLALVLARTEDVGIGLSGVVAEPKGVSFLLDLRRRVGALPVTGLGRPFSAYRLAEAVEHLGGLAELARPLALRARAPVAPASASRPLSGVRRRYPLPWAEDPNGVEGSGDPDR